MSALDQAFIKAYAKETPAAGNSPAHAAPTGERATLAPRRAMSTGKGTTSSSHIENLYADGALYRLETPQAEAEVIPAPHYAAQPQPGTQGRRLAARYRLRRLASEELSPAPPQPAVRFVQRQAARGLSEIARRSARNPQSDTLENELEPPLTEIALPEIPSAAPTEHPASTPTPGPASAVNQVPDVVPPAAQPIVAQQPVATQVPAEELVDLSEFLSDRENVTVSIDWNDAAAHGTMHVESSTMVVWPAESDLASAAAESLMHLDLGSVPAPVLAAPPEAIAPTPVPPLAETPATPIPASPVALPETSIPATPAVTLRLDAEHASGVPAPHFKPAIAPKMAEQAQEVKPMPAVPPTGITPQEAAELVGAAVPTEAILETPIAIPTQVEAPPAEPIVPVWEVDRFFWPTVCEKLLRDDQSYFGQAGGKLISAARDGLRTLAITGSRRGEGRTTLALCLARCAAEAGLNVALMDADFSRPQLAASVGLEVAMGWNQATLDNVSLSEAAIKSIADGMVILPLETSTVATPLSLADGRLAAAVRAAAATFDLLILDLGPLSSGEGEIFPAGEPVPVDAAIVVRDLRYCSALESQAIGERLHAAGVEAVGIAENFVAADK